MDDLAFVRGNVFKDIVISPLNDGNPYQEGKYHDGQDAVHDQGQVEEPMPLER